MTSDFVFSSYERTLSEKRQQLFFISESLEKTLLNLILILTEKCWQVRIMQTVSICFPELTGTENLKENFLINSVSKKVFLLYISEGCISVLV